MSLRTPVFKTGALAVLPTLLRRLRRHQRAESPHNTQLPRLATRYGYRRLKVTSFGSVIKPPPSPTVTDSSALSNLGSSRRRSRLQSRREMQSHHQAGQHRDGEHPTAHQDLPRQ
jgi:hypothetical protein